MGRCRFCSITGQSNSTTVAATMALILVEQLEHDLTRDLAEQIVIKRNFTHARDNQFKCAFGGHPPN